MQRTWQSAQRQRGMLLALVWLIHGTADMKTHGTRARWRPHPSDGYQRPWLAPGRVTNLKYLQWVSCNEISGSNWERWSTSGDHKKEEKMNQKCFFPLLNYPAKFLGSNLLSASWRCKYITTLEPRQGSSGSRTKCNTLV